MKLLGNMWTHHSVWYQLR